MSLFETLQHRRARVLFLSHRNACRTQMAEAFTRALGDDAILAFSAGIAPHARISDAVRAAMLERALPLPPDQHPRSVSTLDLSAFDAIVDFSGRAPKTGGSVLIEPLIPSPLDNDLESHRAVRDRIETFVRFLVEHFRRAKEWSPHINPDAPRTIDPSIQNGPEVRAGIL